jgi:molecular chaperone GrpE
MTTEREGEAAASEGTGRSGVDDVEALSRQLADEREKAQAYMQNWQRAAADYQNYKRRVEEERGEAARLANAALIINLLPLVDDLERALHNVDAHLAGLTWLDGIRLIYRKFQAVLEMSGVEEIPADGETFDPSLHEAVSQGPGEENKIVGVVQRGYRLGDRVIRPAMVVVGTGAGAGRGAADED